MRAYLDCPACSCLIEARESSCPFCGAALRSAGAAAPSWLALGLVFGLGAATIGCIPKDDGDDDTVTATQPTETASETHASATMTNPDSPDGVTYAGPDENWTTEVSTSTTEAPGPTTIDTQMPDASTYAGPDETDTVAELTTSGTTDTDTGTGTTADTDTSDPFPDASTYAGPDYDPIPEIR